MCPLLLLLLLALGGHRVPLSLFMREEGTRDETATRGDEEDLVRRDDDDEDEDVSRDSKEAACFLCATRVDSDTDSARHTVRESKAEMDERREREKGRERGCKRGGGISRRKQ